MTGDVRYNVIEWDIYNQASYGGLGPSIAHQLTGETISANVLIQGPEILKIYRKWFDASRTARDLRARGLIALADAELLQAQTSIDQQMSGWQQGKGQLRMRNSQGLNFRITSDLPQLADNPRIEFDPWPAGVTFASYMSGYWLDTVGHEVGHNMGLRHNFRGSLGGADRPLQGQVSRSIMEYLPITHRYLDFAGGYDQMALKYGYEGVAPTSRIWFCTDEGKASADRPGNSAECTTDDANIDAFGYFEAKLNKAIDYLVAPGSADAPTWKLENMKGQVDKALNGLLSYANSAAQTSSGWTNWRTGHPERPTAPGAIKTFVLGRVKGALCAARIDQAIAQKSTAAAKDVARANVSDLRSHAATLFATYRGIGSASAIGCSAR